MFKFSPPDYEDRIHFLEQRVEYLLEVYQKYIVASIEQSKHLKTEDFIDEVAERIKRKQI